MESYSPVVHERARRRVEAKGWRPRNCVWEVTLECNLRCGHCGSRAGKARADELSTTEALRVVGELAVLGTELLTLSGGEPTLREDWDIIAKAATERGVLVNMVTNGVYGSGRSASEIARRAKAAGMTNVGISVDGPKEVHDSIRGAGTYEKTLNSIREFTNEGVRVAVLTTINRMNFPVLEQIKALVQESGATMWRLQLGKPMGSLSDHMDWVIAPRQVPELVRRLATMKSQGGVSLAIGDSIGYYGPHDKVLRGWGWRQRNECWQGCQAGMHAIGIEANGGIKGCLSLQAKVGEADPFVEGNVRETSLLELWNRPGVFAYNRDFELDQLSGECRKCSKAKVCRGGARCVTSAVGDMSDNPYCAWRYEDHFSLGEAVRGSAVGAAAALWISMGLGGCDKDGPAPEKDVVSDVAKDLGVDSCCDPEYGTIPDFDMIDNKPSDAINCEEVCCECDYGVLPDEVRDACCKPAKDITTADQLPDGCCQPEYGIEPDVIFDTYTDNNVTDVTGDTTKPDAINCADVCCECDYGVLPDDVYQACCQPEYGVEVDVVPQDVASDVAPDAVNCDDVCCDCEYGIIPDEVYEACCKDPCENVCCECDYGAPPPPGCCDK